MHRSVKIDIAVKDFLLQRKIIESIRLYRAACRKAFSICAMAEMAGAEIIEDPEKGIVCMPKQNAAKEILEQAFDIHGKKAHLYELRLWLRELHPSWLSIVPEAIHIDVSSRWRAKDVEFPKATRGYLVLNGARSMARFEHIGITIKNTVPTLAGRTVSFKWDEDIGKVELNLAKLDGSRFFIWRMIESKAAGWKLGTLYLNEKDNNLFITMSYTCPDLKKELDKRKNMLVEFSESQENYITAHSPDEAFSGDVINVTGAVAWLKEMECIYGNYKARLRTYGSVNKKWGGKTGYRAVVERMNRYTERRKNGEQYHNHLWTRRITEHCRRKEAGNVIVVNCPSAEMFGLPWGWYQFQQFLKYKIEEIGGVVKFETIEKQKVA